MAPRIVLLSGRGRRCFSVAYSEGAIVSIQAGAVLIEKGG